MKRKRTRSSAQIYVSCVTKWLMRSWTLLLALQWPVNHRSFFRAAKHGAFSSLSRPNSQVIDPIFRIENLKIDSRILSLVLTIIFESFTEIGNWKFVIKGDICMQAALPDNLKSIKTRKNKNSVIFFLLFGGSVGTSKRDLRSDVIACFCVSGLHLVPLACPNCLCPSNLPSRQDEESNKCTGLTFFNACRDSTPSQ